MTSQKKQEKAKRYRDFNAEQFTGAFVGNIFRKALAEVQEERANLSQDDVKQLLNVLVRQNEKLKIDLDEQNSAFKRAESRLKREMEEENNYMIQQEEPAILGYDDLPKYEPSEKTDDKEQEQEQSKEQQNEK